jgi:hypothetical protein
LHRIWDLSFSHIPQPLLQVPLQSPAKELVIGGEPSCQDIVVNADLLSSPLIDLISQVIHYTSSPLTIADVIPHNSVILQLNPPSLHLILHSRNWFQVILYLRPSILPPIPPRHDILYNTGTSYGVFPLPQYLFPFSGAAHKSNIAFLGLLTGLAPLPLTQIQA